MKYFYGRFSPLACMLEGIGKFLDTGETLLGRCTLMDEYAVFSRGVQVTQMSSFNFCKSHISLSRTTEGKVVKILTGLPRASAMRTAELAWRQALFCAAPGRHPGQGLVA